MKSIIRPLSIIIAIPLSIALLCSCVSNKAEQSNADSAIPVTADKAENAQDNETESTLIQIPYTERIAIFFGTSSDCADIKNGYEISKITMLFHNKQLMQADASYSESNFEYSLAYLIVFYGKLSPTISFFIDRNNNILYGNDVLSFDNDSAYNDIRDYYDKYK